MYASHLDVFWKLLLSVRSYNTNTPCTMPKYCCVSVSHLWCPCVSLHLHTKRKCKLHIKTKQSLIPCIILCWKFNFLPNSSHTHTRTHLYTQTCTGGLAGRQTGWQTDIHTRVETGLGHPGYILSGLSWSDLLYKTSRSDILHWIMCINHDTWIWSKEWIWRTSRL